MGISPALAVALAGTAVAAGGAAYSYSEQSSAADAQRAQNDAAISAQNQGFWSRNADQQRQLAAQTTAQQTSQEAQSRAFNTMRDQQTAALSARDQTIQSENQTASDIRARADTEQQKLLDATSGQSLTDAQTADAASRAGGMAPAVQNISTASPLGAPQGSDTKQAYAKRIAEAADSVRSYGQRLAQVSSYTAPLTTVGQSISQEQAGIMPVAAANQLLQSGQGVRLLPSQTAYQTAGSEGAAKQQQIAAALEGELNVAKNQYEGSTNVADLRQGNTNTIAGNTAAEAKSQAAAGQALGNLISTGGNLATYGSTRYADALNGPVKPTATPQPVAPPIAPGTIR